MANKESAVAVKEDAIAIAGNYAMFKGDIAMLTEAMTENLASQKLTLFDLDKIKVPTGGGTVFKVPTAAGNKNIEKLVGIIIAVEPGRSYWEKEFDGSNTPPDCTSIDGLRGVGKPGGLCEACAMNEYGSAVKSPKAKACKETKSVLFVPENGLMPMVLQVPPTSLKACKQYLMRLVSGDEECPVPMPFYGVLTEFTLRETKNGGGIEYSEILFRRVGALSAEQAKAVKTYRDGIMPAFKRAHAENVGAAKENEGPKFDK